MDFDDFLVTLGNDPLRNSLWDLHRHMESFLILLAFTPTLTRVEEGDAEFVPGPPDDFLRIPFDANDQGVVFHEATHDLFHYSVFHSNHRAVNGAPQGQDEDPDFNENWGEGFCEAVRWLMEMIHLPGSQWLAQYNLEIAGDWRKQLAERILNMSGRSLVEFRQCWFGLVHGYDETPDYLNRTIPQ